MKFLYTTFLLFTILICQAQNQHRGVVLDSEVKEPLEFVNIFNSTDNTISNADGQFAFSSDKDSIIFYRVGYDKLETTFEKLKDTIFLSKSVFELTEVVVTNQKTVWQKVMDSIRSNYKIEPYKERFFMRCVLRRNDTIVRIQDMVGKLKRKTMFYSETMEQSKKDFEVELTEMRKVGISSDENDVYFIFPSFFQTLKGFVKINATGKGFELDNFQLEKGTKTRLNFKGIGAKKVWKNEGHYIINNLDNAILSMENSETSEDAIFTKNKWLRYRTLKNESKKFFVQDVLTNDYFLKSAKNYFIVEAVDKEETFRNIFTIEVIINTFDNFGDFDVKSNINEHKDMFKLKHPYSEPYWKSQNHLLLTDEMKTFISAMGEENKEFKIRSNLD